MAKNLRDAVLLIAPKARDLAWVVPSWTETKRPPVIVLEDIEYVSWKKPSKKEEK